MLQKIFLLLHNLWKIKNNVVYRTYLSLYNRLLSKLFWWSLIIKESKMIYFYRLFITNEYNLFWMKCIQKVDRLERKFILIVLHDVDNLYFYRILYAETCELYFTPIFSNKRHQIHLKFLFTTFQQCWKVHVLSVCVCPSSSRYSPILVNILGFFGSDCKLLAFNFAQTPYKI